MDIRHAVGVKARIPGEKLAAVTSYKDSPLFTERERAALEFSEQITRADQEVSDECFRRLRRYFSDPEIVELTFIVGFQTFASKFAKAFRLTAQGYSSLNRSLWMGERWGPPGSRRQFRGLASGTVLVALLVSAEVRPPLPDGASGYHTIRLSMKAWK